MPGTRHAPTLESEIAKLQRRVSQLERQLGAVIDTRIMPAVFSFSGALSDAVGTESPHWRPVHPIMVDLLVPQVLGAPSGGDVTVDMTLYGPVTGVAITLTIPDGQTYAEIASPFRIGMGGSLTATVTADNGATDLSIAVVPRLLI